MSWILSLAAQSLNPEATFQSLGCFLYLAHTRGPLPKASPHPSSPLSRTLWACPCHTSCSLPEPEMPMGPHRHALAHPVPQNQIYSKQYEFNQTAFPNPFPTQIFTSCLFHKLPERARHCANCCSQPWVAHLTRMTSSAVSLVPANSKRGHGKQTQCQGGDQSARQHWGAGGKRVGEPYFPPGEKSWNRL